MKPDTLTLLRTRILSARDAYAVLGVPPGAPPDVIKAAHRAAAGALHPDRCPAPDAADLCARVNAAYGAVADSEARRRYNLAHAVTPCLVCSGSGSVWRQRGFKARAPVTCTQCRGTGR